MADASWSKKNSFKHYDTKFKYTGPPYSRADMYVDHITCSPMVNHGEYADGTDRQIKTDGRQTVALRFPLNSANVIKRNWHTSSILKDTFLDEQRQ